MHRVYTLFMDPVECKNGHINDPYPEGGQCVVCRLWLPGNKNIWKEENTGEGNTSKADRKKALKAKARNLLKDLGFEWGDAPSHLRMIAETATRTSNSKDMEFLLQQVGELKAKPKSAEDTVEAEIVVSVDMKAMGDTLKVLDALSRD